LGVCTTFRGSRFGLSVVGADTAISYGYPGAVGARWINPIEII
jgi:hypothetical protein